MAQAMTGGACFSKKYGPKICTSQRLPACRVVPRAANRNEHDCRWQSYLYCAVMGQKPMTEGVNAIDTVKAIVR